MSHQATDTVPLLEGPEQLYCSKLLGLLAQLKGKVRNFPRLFRLTPCQEGTGECRSWERPVWMMLDAVISPWTVLCPSNIDQAVEK